MGTPKRKINGHHCCFGYSAGRNVRIILELFRLIDVHDEMALNDVQFCAFMKTATDLNTNQIYKVFDMLDVDGSGAMDFDEFYLLICILIAVQDKVKKNLYTDILALCLIFLMKTIAVTFLLTSLKHLGFCSIYKAKRLEPFLESLMSREIRYVICL